MTELPPCYCGGTHRTLEHRDCFCTLPNCCDAPDKHCGQTSYGCWFKDFTAEELAEMEALAKATVQGDGDFNWGAQIGSTGCGVVYRDQCGNLPIVYDADDIYNKTLPKYPEFPRNWLKATEEEKEAYIAEAEKFREEYFRTHPDLAFIGEMDPGRVLRLIQMARRNLPTLLKR